MVNNYDSIFMALSTSVDHTVILYDVVGAYIGPKYGWVRKKLILCKSYDGLVHQ